MPKVEVLKPFVGSMDKSNKYGHPMTRVIPHRRFGARWEPLGPNVIEVTEERAKELEALQLVKPYVPPAEPAAPPVAVKK